MSNDHQHHHPNVEVLVREVAHAQNKQLDRILRRIKRMSQELDNLTAQVKANSDAVDAAVLLINGIADRITAAGVDPAKLTALTDELKSKDDTLAAAVVANTPAA
jgi:alpha-beta hydrolase superfamily lysophospholipase